MDDACYVNCKSMKTQTMAQMNACNIKNKVDEDIGDDTCKPFPFMKYQGGHLTTILRAQGASWSTKDDSNVP